MMMMMMMMIMMMVSRRDFDSSSIFENIIFPRELKIEWKKKFDDDDNDDDDGDEKKFECFLYFRKYYFSARIG